MSYGYGFPALLAASLPADNPASKSSAGRNGRPRGDAPGGATASAVKRPTK